MIRMKEERLWGLSKESMRRARNAIRWPERGSESQELTRKNRSKELLLRRQMTSPAQEVKVRVETRLVGGSSWR